MEPTVRFVWEDRGQGGDAPVFDGQDAFTTRADLGFLLESRLLRCSDLGEVASLDLGRGVDLARVRREGPAGAWGPWSGRLATHPREHLLVRAEGEFDPRVRDPWLHWSFTAEDQDLRGDRVFAGYHYLKERAGYLDAGAELAIVRALSLQYRQRRSVRDARALEEAVGLHLAHSCWEIVATFSRNYRKEDALYEQRYFLAVQLKGLGKLGTLRGIVP
jgi:hypothetical protein